MLDICQQLCFVPNLALCACFVRDCVLFGVRLRTMFCSMFCSEIVDNVLFGVFVFKWIRISQREYSNSCGLSGFGDKIYSISRPGPGHAKS